MKQDELRSKIRDAIWGLTDAKPSDHTVEQVALVVERHFGNAKPVKRPFTALTWRELETIASGTTASIAIMNELIHGYCVLADMYMSGDACVIPKGAEGERLRAIVEWGKVNGYL